MGPFEKQVEKQFTEGYLNVRPLTIRSIRTPPGYKLEFTGRYERFSGGRPSKMDYDIYTLSDREGEVASITGNTDEGGPFQASLDPFRKRHRDIFMRMSRLEFGMDRGPEKDLQTSVEDAIRQVEIAKARIEEME